LKRMARRTSRANFRQLVAAARAHIPDLNLSTDLIVGFPGETEADFDQSLHYVAELSFSRLHVFSYSPRPGTAAAQFSGQVQGHVKKERAGRLIALGEQLSLAFHERYVGQSLNVLWEMNTGADPEGLRWVGYTDNYIRIQAHGPADLFNRITPTRLLSAQPDGATGKIIGND
jgi:threonylcarbamoyladenosine tRNA methylthiotransferase MtaB